VRREKDGHDICFLQMGSKRDEVKTLLSPQPPSLIEESTDDFAKNCLFCGLKTGLASVCFQDGEVSSAFTVGPFNGIFNFVP
jgi:hypothetical protein